MFFLNRPEVRVPVCSMIKFKIVLAAPAAWNMKAKLFSKTSSSSLYK